MPRRGGVRPPVPRDLRRHADAVRRQRGGPRRRPGFGIIPGTIRWITDRAAPPADAVEPARRARAPTRCSPVSATRRGCTSCTRCTACPTTPRRSWRHVRLRRHGERRVPLRQRVRHAVPPGEVGAVRARAAAQLRRLRWRTCVVIELYPGDRPARRQGGAPPQGDYDAADHLRRRPGRRRPRVRRRRARAGSTSSTSTRRAAARR